MRSQKKLNQAKERDSAGHEPDDEGGSSHHKAMRRLERKEKRLWSRIERIVGNEESTRSRRSRSEPVEGSREAE